MEVYAQCVESICEVDFMTNYEYIKTLSQDELVTFIMNDMTMAANDILDEAIRCWSDDERSSTEIRMWKNWLNEQHEEKY